jgi:hypothetical protein
MDFNGRMSAGRVGVGSASSSSTQSTGNESIEFQNLNSNVLRRSEAIFHAKLYLGPGERSTEIRTTFHIN